MAKHIKREEIGKPKTLTLRLDAEVATHLDRLISRSRESTYASLITSMIMQWDLLNTTVRTEVDQAKSARIELDEFKRKLAELKGVMQFMGQQLDQYEVVGQRSQRA